jgi:opacity protein-like surface antigen
MRILAIAVLLVALTGISHAQGSRSKTWELSVSGIYQDSKRLGGDNGSSVDIDSELGFGFSLAYNLSSKLSLGGDFEFIRPDYTAVLIAENPGEEDIVINHEMYQFNGRFKGTYNFVDGPLTPFVEAGLGWSYFDSNVTDGPPTTGCYWHPWWGYICNNFYSTFDDTLFSYGAGVGLRYEFSGGSFLKATYNHWEMDGMGDSSDAAFNAAKLEFGWSF